MHPAIMIINAVLLIVMLASGRTLAVLLAAMIILLLLLRSYAVKAAPDLRAVARLRWLFLSILVLYCLFPPVAGSWQQELLAGLAEAGERILALALIVILVQIMFSMGSRQLVLAGLLWLLRPLAGLMIPVERFALRLLLVMELTPRVQNLLATRTDASAGRGSRPAARVRRLADSLTAAFERVLAEAERAPLPAIEVPMLRAPAPWQWLLPCLLVGLFAGIMAAG